MAPNNPAYLELRLSGGTGNAKPEDSLGGVMSNQRIFSHSVTGFRHITGVSIDDAPGCPNGSGTLSFSALGQSLVWTPPHGVAGVPSPVTGNGRLAVLGSAGFVFLNVDAAALPTVDQSDTLMVNPLAQTLFNDIAPAESLAGATAYRCCYLYNAHDADAFDSISLFISAQPSGPDTLAIALDPAGSGDGITTGVASRLPDQYTAPDPAVVFTDPNTLDTALTLGPLVAGQAHALWLRRTVPGHILTSLSTDLSALAFGLSYRVRV